MTTDAFLDIIRAEPADRADLFLTSARRLGAPLINIEKDILWEDETDRAFGHADFFGHTGICPPHRLLTDPLDESVGHSAFVVHVRQFFTPDASSS